MSQNNEYNVSVPHRHNSSIFHEKHEKKVKKSLGYIYRERAINERKYNIRIGETYLTHIYIDI